MREKKCGIYCIENLVNGKKYIGKSIDIGFRWNGHRTKFKNKKHANPYFQNSYDKYGEENFKYSIIEICEKEELSEREIFYIKEFNTKHPNGYNVTDGGEGAAGLKRAPRTPEHSKKIGDANRGKHHNISDEDREKMRQRMIGNKLGVGWVPSQEYRENHSKKMTGKIYASRGRKQSPELIARRVETQRINRERKLAEKLEREGPPPEKIIKERVYSQEYRQNARERMKGTSFNKGRVLSPETIVKRQIKKKQTIERKKREKLEKEGQMKLEGIE
jgi:group I intron endonuclease